MHALKRITTTVGIITSLLLSGGTYAQSQMITVERFVPPRFHRSRQ